MLKLKDKDYARQMATRKGERYGLCVFDGFYYVGTLEELNKIGVMVENLGREHREGEHELAREQEDWEAERDKALEDKMDGIRNGD